MTGYISPSAKSWLDDKVPAHRRVPLVRLLTALALLYAAFLAFSDERMKRLAAERDRDGLRRELVVEKQKKNTAPRAMATPAPHASLRSEAPKPYLIRSLELSSFNVQFAGRTDQGIQAINLSDVTYCAFSEVSGRMENRGNDTLRYQVVHVSADQPGKTRAKFAVLPKGILSPGAIFPFAIRVTPERRILEGDKPINIVIVVEYDTIPATGIRRTTLKYRTDIKWQGPQPGNNTVPVPQQDVQLLDRQET